MGNSGSGTFTQTGGTNTVSNTPTLAANSAAAAPQTPGAQPLGRPSQKQTPPPNQTGGSLNATTFNQQGGTVTGALENRGVFNYTSGTFSGRLLNYGSLNLGPSFTAGNGLLHDSATTLAIASGQGLTLNGQGLTNERTMTLAGGCPPRMKSSATPAPARSSPRAAAPTPPAPP